MPTTLPVRMRQADTAWQRLMPQDPHATLTLILTLVALPLILFLLMLFVSSAIVGHGEISRRTLATALNVVGDSNLCLEEGICLSGDDR